MATVQPANPINVESTKAPKNHSNFDLSRMIGITPRFGVNTPFYSEEVVPDDGPISIEPSCDTRSYSLKAPMFGDIKKHVAFYQVPLQAILPLNWEKIVVNSSKGSDVQGDSNSGDLVSSLDGVNCVVSDFPRRITDLFMADFDALKTNLSDILGSAIDESKFVSYANHVFHFMIRWEMFFSNGSLLSCLGVHYSHLLEFRYRPSDSGRVTRIDSFDKFCQVLLAPVLRFSFTVSDDDGSSSISGEGASFVRKVLDFMRSHSAPFVFSSPRLVNSPITSELSRFSLSSITGDDTEPLNFGRCVAYQIVNAHYYTNDKIDYIYSADLYRQYIGSLVFPLYDYRTFVYNGIVVGYDWLSGFYLSLFFNDFSLMSYIDLNFWRECFPYLNAIFGFNYSLRFMDYFVGARPRNLAISGPNTPTNVQVANNSVSVIDTTKSIVAQRFLNAVARAGQSIESYSSKVLGKYIAPDWHNPKYLFDFDVNLFTSEIENTGVAQQSEPNSVTSVLRGKCGNVKFTFDIDRHSFIVGIEYFDLRRFYYTTQDRNTMAIDRFDMFIPELQYIGDQELKRSELIAGSQKDMPFGYTLRDMQFKQSFDICSGGFVENLPGWLATFDLDDMTYRNINEQLYISPEFIRSRPSEVDKFYVSLTGLTLGSYFHFIELWYIKVSANRPMVYAPQIL